MADNDCFDTMHSMSNQLYDFHHYYYYLNYYGSIIFVHLMFYEFIIYD